VGATVVELGPAFKRLPHPGVDGYRDDIHPSALGQKAIADALGGEILRALNPVSTAPTK
jgi:hypothetical protein